MTISLDSLIAQRFQRDHGRRRSGKVFEAIDAAKLHGFDPVKINAVIVRGVNDDELVDFARFARENRGRDAVYRVYAARFRPRMEPRNGRSGPRDIRRDQCRLSAQATKPLARQRNRLEILTSPTAHRARSASSPRLPKCSAAQCSRIRLTADGQIRTCLFSTVEHDLRDYLRSGASRSELVEFIEAVTLKKEPSHRINEPDFAPSLHEP